MHDLADLKFDSSTGLIPVVVQDWRTREVLMLAYANREAIVKTLDTGYAHYWSRKRKCLWKKGETSGNVQKIVDIIFDCDADAILYIVDQIGAACHTGAKSCFHNSLRSANLQDTNLFL
ncbi:MAG: phosphoribosyl-AMP cyclohydrolase [Candidatus Bathyarchaeia archaeon]